MRSALRGAAARAAEEFVAVELRFRSQLALVDRNDFIDVGEQLDERRGGRAAQPGDVRIRRVGAQSPDERRCHDDVADSRQPNDEESFIVILMVCEATGGRGFGSASHKAGLPPGHRTASTVLNANGANQKKFDESLLVR